MAGAPNRSDHADELPLGHHDGGERPAGIGAGPRIDGDHAAEVGGGAPADVPHDDRAIDGEHLGSVGVLGPTRMNYPQALATVEYVSEQLGHRIEEG